MKKPVLLFLLSTLVAPAIYSQWYPRLVDSTLVGHQSNPLVAIGPNRELAIVFNDQDTGNERLMCYISRDLGNSFTRVLVDSGSYSPPWRTYHAGIPTGLGFDNQGQIILMDESSYIDDIVEFTNYGIGILRPDSIRFSTVWSAVGSGGPGPPLMKKPTMVIQDSVLHVLRGEPFSGGPRQITYTRISGEQWVTVRDHLIFSFPSIPGIANFDGRLLVGSVAVHGLVNKASYQSGMKNSLYYTYIQHGNSVPIPTIPIDTLYATSPLIVDLGSGHLALLYAAGNGSPYSDSILTTRAFTEGDTMFSPPYRLTAKPIRATYSSESNSPIMHSDELGRCLVYRSYDASGPMVAFYQFAALQSPPIDSMFFEGYDHADLALDSLGGKYLVMIGSDQKLYLMQKDVVSSLRDNGNTPSELVLDQNYPNPFNPVTRIGFRIQERGFVSLKVFDVLGREVATLVNEEIRPGEYQKIFDGQAFSGGVYFYRLQASGFIQTRKLLLLK